jgi:hypothetical protein
MPSLENEAISGAIEAWVASLPFEGDGDIGVLGDWVSVVCMVRVNDEGEPVAHYYLGFKNGTSLPHVAEGLLRQGLLELNPNIVESD